MNGSSPDGDDETYEQLLDFLTADDDLAAAAAWRQVAVEQGHPPPSGSLDESPGPRFEMPVEDEHHLGSSCSWQDRSGE